jgi:phosphoenolpyruvate-protein phosphotransferase/dihydroxyacetone kinase phosphotransfer subunit
LVGIVIVSHSQELAAGVCELALQMAGGQPVPVVPAGGTDDGSLGTSLQKVTEALEQVLDHGEALVLADLGSAVMVTQMAVEFLPPEQQGQVHLTSAPLVEGAIAAVVTAAGGGDLEAVRRAAEQALDIPKIPSEEPFVEPEAPVEPEVAGPVESVELAVLNPTGLHARPAALFVRTAMRFQADITVQNVTHGRPPADAKSMMDVANRGTAWHGERIRIVARGEDAAEAIATLRQVVESGFGEMEEAAMAPAMAPKVPAIPATPAPAGLPARIVAAVEEEEVEGRLRGIPASEGIAVAPAFLYHPPELQVEHRTVTDVDAETARLHQALRQAREELTDLQTKVAERDEHVARIFEFQRMMLEDQTLVEAIEGEIHRAACNAEAAVEQVMAEWVARFEEMDDVLMRLRAADVRDVGDRVVRILLGVQEERSLSTLPEPVIVVAQDLTPSDTARLDRGKVQGLCTATGGATSHIAILARMWNIPAVVGLGDPLLRVPDGALVALDGEAGMVEVEPSPEVVQAYHERQARRAALQAAALRQTGEPARTQDGQQVEVVANVGDVASAREAIEQGAEGIGLLRTEFLYLDRTTLPDEREQVNVYQAIAEVMGQRPVIVRTMDVGADKPLPAIPRPEEANPALGMRAIRLARRHPDLLLVQLRAILRAGAGHNLKVMFPMVVTLDEVRWAKGLIRQAREELAAEGTQHAGEIETGIMVETPAAAVMADVLAKEVDFFSIGSNDLTQYTLASDRVNEQLGDLYRPLDPAVLRLIAQVIHAAHAAGKWVGLCGELAGQRLAIPVLLGLGLDEFSMTPSAIPVAKQLIRSLSLAEARQIADHALSLSTASEVTDYLSSVLEGPA